ncbi:TetR/AcrR family transcriptional regulator [Natrialbaceae archaeon GCM10025810]|uniref:TetR/AcrR family transcriptional regulator n=1 Tax=Halovalidus salilacus TaxID=3075124 RepID=UPI00360FA9F3
MSGISLEFHEPETTREEMLIATFKALSTHGYADLTIAKIGDEFDKSPSLIYHHYDDKEALVLDCLEFMLDHFETTLLTTCTDDPRDALLRFIDRTLDACSGEPDPLVETLVELRARTNGDAFYDHFTRSDSVFQAHLESTLRAGIDDGVFENCDAERIAATVLTTLTGALYRGVTSDADADISATRSELVGYLEGRLGVDDGFDSRT